MRHGIKLLFLDDHTIHSWWDGFSAENGRFCYVDPHVMFKETLIRGITFRPALFCAPLAGLTHSALRRVIAEFGGCGACWTEMLAAKQILREDPLRSPYLRRSPGEQRLIYQLMLRENDPIEQIIARLAGAGPDGIDINLACHAPVIRNLDAGSSLFEDLAALSSVLATVRRCWAGLLTVKIRLGRDAPGWQGRFEERMKCFEDHGVDAVVLHPRFFEDKFKRRARYEHFAWAASLTRLPLIANGDIVGPGTLREHADLFKPAAALMIGRLAVAQPWIFAAWNQPLTVDYTKVWIRVFDCICEDFAPEVAISRIKLFTKYYARNFKFGHSFQASVQNGPTLDAVRERALAFLETGPGVFDEPSLMGL